MTQINHFESRLRPRLPSVADQSSRIPAGLSYMGLSVLFIAPLIAGAIRFTAGRRDLFVRQHSTEALNLYLTGWVLAVLTLICGVLGGAVFGPLTNVFAFLFFAWLVVALVESLVGLIAAFGSKWTRLPINIRWVPGAVRTRAGLPVDPVVLASIKPYWDGQVWWYRCEGSWLQRDGNDWRPTAKEPSLG